MQQQKLYSQIHIIYIMRKTTEVSGELWWYMIKKYQSS